eukprot:COSAG05_NODE_5300_length_1211_cov_23.031475_2_plen_131_part_00
MLSLSLSPGPRLGLPLRYAQSEAMYKVASSMDPDADDLQERLRENAAFLDLVIYREREWGPTVRTLRPQCLLSWMRLAYPWGIQVDLITHYACRITRSAAEFPPYYSALESEFESVSVRHSTGKNVPELW